MTCVTKIAYQDAQGQSATDMELTFAVFDDSIRVTIGEVSYKANFVQHRTALMAFTADLQMAIRLNGETKSKPDTYNADPWYGREDGVEVCY